MTDCDRCEMKDIPPNHIHEYEDGLILCEGCFRTSILAERVRLLEARAAALEGSV